MKKTILIASCLISCSILLGSYLMSHQKQDLTILTEEDLANYLHIPKSDLEKRIRDDQGKKQKLITNNSLWNTYQFIPLVEIQGHTIFMKEEIDKWLKYLSVTPAS